MNTRLFSIVLCVGLLWVSSPYAQTSSRCMTQPYGPAYTAKLVTFITDPDSTSIAARDSLGLALGTAQDVQLVLDTLLCQQAATAFDSADVAFFAASSRAREVYVFKVQSVYFVIDPKSVEGHYAKGLVFSESWQYRGGMFF